MYYSRALWLVARELLCGCLGDLLLGRCKGVLRGSNYIAVWLLECSGWLTWHCFTIAMVVARVF